MAEGLPEKKALKEGTDEESKNSVDSTLEDAERNLASLRQTIAAIDDFETRWKDIQKKFGEVISLSLSSALGVPPPCTVTEDEKKSVFGGNPTLLELCKRLKRGSYRKVIVLTGAGISVSAGIPDFRSPGSGLYETLELQRDQLHLPSAQAVFDIKFFKEDPKPFFVVMKQLFYTKTYKPTTTHHFIKLLSDKGFLLRCFTQNIDGLEKKAGIPENLLVRAHGSIESATCTNPSCKKKYFATKTDLVESAVKANEIPRCNSCADRSVVKPDIVFFGEDLSPDFKKFVESDFDECDLLIVMGTSLKVLPFSTLANKVKQTTPRLMINKERVGSFVLPSEGGYRDIVMLEDCDNAVCEVCKLCQWNTELEKLVKSGATKTGTKVIREKSFTPKTSDSCAHHSPSSVPTFKKTKK